MDAARARLAELEAGFAIEKAKVEAMKARLFARLRERWMASLRRAMPTTPQAHFFRMALRARDWHGARSGAIHRASAQEERKYAETAAALA